MESQNFQKISALLNRSTIKPPAYEWQDLALQIVKELNIPPFKKSAVFKVCRDLPKQYILHCLNDTKELVQTGEKWRYFFKLTDNYGKTDNFLPKEKNSNN